MSRPMWLLLSPNAYKPPLRNTHNWLMYIGDWHLVKVHCAGYIVQCRIGKIGLSSPNLWTGKGKAILYVHILNWNTALIKQNWEFSHWLLHVEYEILHIAHVTSKRILVKLTLVILNIWYLTFAIFNSQTLSYCIFANIVIQ